MDALPIKEETGLVHASTCDGVMHACGHDGHVAILLAAARVCSEMPELNGTVNFIFQPAEENEGGARRMIEDGLFRRFPCDSIYALHNWPALPVGTIVARDGPIMASFATFEIEVRGRGCHGAMPQEGSDSVLTACQLVASIPQIVTHNISPTRSAVISTTRIHGGNTWNVIPETCTLAGSARWLEDGVGYTIERRLHEVSTAVSHAFGCTAKVSFERRFPPTVNHIGPASRVREIARGCGQQFVVADAPPSMASEDFAWMLQSVPGCYIWLGAMRDGNNPGLHSPNFDFNDEVLSKGVGLWVSLVHHSLCRMSDVDTDLPDLAHSNR